MRRAVCQLTWPSVELFLSPPFGWPLVWLRWNNSSVRSPHQTRFASTIRTKRLGFSSAINDDTVIMFQFISDYDYIAGQSIGRTVRGVLFVLYAPVFSDIAGLRPVTMLAGQCCECDPPFPPATRFLYPEFNKSVYCQDLVWLEIFVQNLTITTSFHQLIDVRVQSTSTKYIYHI